MDIMTTLFDQDYITELYGNERKKEGIKEGIAAYATKYVANKLGTKYCSYPCTVHWWRYGSKYDKNGYPYIIASPGSSAMICNTENCSTSGYVATVRPVMYIYL